MMLNQKFNEVTTELLQITNELNRETHYQCSFDLKGVGLCFCAAINEPGEGLGRSRVVFEAFSAMRPKPEINDHYLNELDRILKVFQEFRNDKITTT